MLFSIILIISNLSFFVTAHPFTPVVQRSVPASNITLKNTKSTFEPSSARPELRSDGDDWRAPNPDTHHEFDNWQDWGSYEDINAYVRCTRVPNEGYRDFYTPRNIECFFWQVGDDAVPSYMFTPCSGTLIHHLQANRHYRLNSGTFRGNSIWLNCFVV
jgi:hypothetical protein